MIRAADRRSSPARGDRGSITPLILTLFLVAFLMVMGTISAGSAFLEQRDLQAVCDGAAVRAASALDEAGAYAGPAGQSALPLSDASVQDAVADYQARGYPADPTLAMSATTDGRVVVVSCSRVVQIPFGATFGKADGLQRTAVSSARSPLGN